MPPSLPQGPRDPPDPLFLPSWTLQVSPPPSPRRPYMEGSPWGLPWWVCPWPEKPRRLALRSTQSGNSVGNTGWVSSPFFFSFIVCSFFPPFWRFYGCIIDLQGRGHFAAQVMQGCMYTHTFSLGFFSHLDDHRLLGRVLCAIQQVPIGQWFHIPPCASASPKPPVHPDPDPTPPVPFGYHKFFKVNLKKGYKWTFFFAEQKDSQTLCTLFRMKSPWFLQILKV